MKLAGLVMALAMFAFALLAEPARAVMPDPAVTPGAVPIRR
jgi:hypothetical protein